MLPVVFKPSPRIFYVGRALYLGRRSAFICASQLPFEGFFRYITPGPFQAFAANKFGCDRSIIKSTLFEEQSLFSAVTQCPLGGLCWKFILRQLLASAKNSKFDSDQSVIRGSLLGLHCIVHFRLYLGFHGRDFPENYYLSFSPHALEAAQVCLRPANILLGEHSVCGCICAATGIIFLNILTWR
jgi:hypothetical protein